MTGLISKKLETSIQAGILSWKSDTTLQNTLQSLSDSRFFDLFDRTTLYFQEVRPQDITRAEQFGLNWVGSETNRHIGGGFYNLIKSIDSEYIFLLEDDLTLFTTSDALRQALEDGIELIEKGAIDIFTCRRDDLLKKNYTKYLKIHSPNQASIDQQPIEFIRRNGLQRLISGLRHPEQKFRMIGKAIWIEQHPERLYPEYITKHQAKNHDIYSLQGRPTKWSNPGILARKEWLLKVYGYIEEQTPGFNEFGQSLEYLMNIKHRHWWLAQNFRMGFSTDVLIRHQRKDDGGKTNFK